MAAARRDPGAAAVRVLRARRTLAAARNGREVRGHAQSRAHHPRHRADHVRCAQQSLQPGCRRRARKSCGQKVYDTIIPRNVRVSEAPSYGKPVLVYDLKCVGSEAYLRLATEIIQREKELTGHGTPASRRSNSVPAISIATKARHERDDAHARVRYVLVRSNTMADESRSRLGRGLAALIGDAADTATGRSRAQRSAACRSNSSRPIHAIRAAFFPKQSSMSLPPRSKSAASSSRSWCAPCAAQRTATRSSRANGAGGRRSAPACTTCRSSCSK